MTSLPGELIAGLVPALRTVTLLGLALAGLGQIGVAAWLNRRYHFDRASRRRLSRAIIRADLLAFGLTLLITKIGFHLNHGRYNWREAVIAAQVMVTSVAVLLVYTREVSRGLRRPSLPGGIAIAAVTFLGLALPGLRLSVFQRPAEVTRKVVRFSHLPPELDGLRILLVGDTHVGQELTPANTAARLRPLRGIQADLVVFAGDLATGDIGGMEFAVKLLDGALPRRARFAVLGNHDQWSGAGGVTAELVAHGFRVLQDEGQLMKAGGARIWVAGVTNGYNKPGDIARALQGAPDDAFILLLAHSPDVVEDPLAQRADLILSGHTHGGQVLLPLVGPLACSSGVGPRYASGLFDVGVAKLFVTRGIGEVVTPFRLLCEPEIAVLELRGPAHRQ